MKISNTYRFVARLISATLFFGVIAPVVLQASMLVHCDNMMEVTDAKQTSMHDHNTMSHSPMEMNSEEDCCMNDELMDHHQTIKEERSTLNHCEIAIDCNCDLDDQAIHKEAVILHQFKVPVSSLSSSINTSFLEDHSDLSPIPIHYSNSYSPPLIFLANESFLI